MNDDNIDYDFGEWIIISATIKTTHNYLMGISNVIFSKNGLYYFIEEERDSLVRVMKMPDYIRNSWIRYNKVDLTVDIIDLHMDYHKVDTQHCTKLIALKRDIKISRLKK